MSRRPPVPDNQNPLSETFSLIGLYADLSRNAQLIADFGPQHPERQEQAAAWLLESLVELARRKGWRLPGLAPVGEEPAKDATPRTALGRKWEALSRGDLTPTDAMALSAAEGDEAERERLAALEAKAWPCRDLETRRLTELAARDAAERQAGAGSVLRDLGIRE
jgi:hypothetical protein